MLSPLNGPTWFTSPTFPSRPQLPAALDPISPDPLLPEPPARAFPPARPPCLFSAGVAAELPAADPVAARQLEAARRQPAPGSRPLPLRGSHKVMAGDRRLINASVTDPVRVQRFKTESRVVQEGQKYLGTPYVWGGSSKSGLDCSGFTYRAMKDAGANVPLEWFRRQVDPRVDPRGAEGYGMKVVKDPRPGDVVVFGKSHVGIYTGNVDGVAMYMSANHGGPWATPGNSGNARVDVMPVRDHFVKPPVYFRYDP